MTAQFTDLALWLQHNNIYPNKLAEELLIDKDIIYFLTFPQGRGRKYKTAKFDVILALSKRTGIRPGTLVEDAMGWEDDDGEE